MSGRVHVTLADGRRVRGYRKTMTQRSPRRYSHEMPDWHLSCTLPNELSFVGLTPGPCVKVLGIEVGEDRHIESSGKSHDWLTVQLARFVRYVAPEWSGKVTFQLHRPAEDRPAISWPLSPARHMHCELELKGSTVFLKSGHSLRTLVV